MFIVQTQYSGQGTWTRNVAPMTALSAAEHAITLRALGFADESRVIPAAPVSLPREGGLDLKV